MKSQRALVQRPLVQIAAGELGTVYRNGLPGGGARHPEFRQTALALEAALRYRF